MVDPIVAIYIGFVGTVVVLTCLFIFDICRNRGGSSLDGIGTPLVASHDDNKV